MLLIASERALNGVSTISILQEVKENYFYN